MSQQTVKTIQQRLTFMAEGIRVQQGFQWDEYECLCRDALARIALHDKLLRRCQRVIAQQRAEDSKAGVKLLQLADALDEALGAPQPLSRDRRFAESVSDARLAAILDSGGGGVPEWEIARIAGELLARRAPDNVGESKS